MNLNVEEYIEIHLEKGEVNPKVKVAVDEVF